MRVIERVTELAGPVRQLVRLEDLVRFVRAQIRKRVAVDVFHRDAARLVAVHEIVDADDVLVGQVEAAPCLALHIAEDRAIVHDQFREEFQGNVSLQLFIARQPDNTHAAATEGFDQRVAIKDLLPATKVAHGRVQTRGGCVPTHGAILTSRRNLIKQKIGREVHAAWTAGAGKFASSRQKR